MKDKGIVYNRINDLLSSNDIVIVSVDGRCGSGKTTLASEIRDHFRCTVYHMDDYYLPLGSRDPGWKQIPAGNMDLQRFLSEVLLRIRNGGTDWGLDRLYVVEGSYSQHPLLASMYDLKVFLTCDADTQAARLRKRERDNYVNFRNIWIPMEENYFRTFDIEEKSDIVINADELVPV